MRRILTTVRLALRNLALHKLRSFLTILGLVFGVASVVAMLAVAEGASLEAQRQIADLGATNIILRSIKPIEETKKQNENSFIFEYGLTRKDFERILETIPTVARATPLREFRKEIRHLDKVVDGRMVGVFPNYAQMNNLKMARGRFINNVDIEQFANVTVLGAEVAEKLFPLENPLGKSVRIGEGQFYTVVGVTKPKSPSAGAGSSLAAQDFNRDAYIPYSTDRVRFGDVLTSRKQGSFTAEKIEISQITATVDSIENVKSTAAALESMLGQFHAKKDFTITVPLELLEKAEATKRIFNAVLGSIAGISLLVGGIGIMNIMLATVTERTREIGIRRALGAKRSDITLQFLVETAVLSATGGLIGVLLGIGAPKVLERISGVPVEVTGWSPIVAFTIAVAVGVGFGVYPARRAASLDPVEALRYE